MRIFYAALILLIPVSLLGVDFEPQGFLDTYHSVRLNDPYDFLSSRTRLRLETWLTGNNVSLFASLNLINNNVITSNSGVEFREAYIDYQAEKWDLRIGRQIIVWGKADGLAITDIVSPWDYTEFLARDFDDIRLAVDALRLRILFDKANFEIIWLPVFKPAVLPPAGTPWALKCKPPENVNFKFDNPIEPGFSLKNSELGGKLSFFLPGFDFAFSSFYTWNDLPTMHRTISNEKGAILIHHHPEHHRVTYFGAEFAIPWRDFVLRAEAAFYKGRYFEPESSLSETLFKRNALNWMVGIDWTPGNDWMLTAQFVDNLIFDYDKAIKEDEHTILATLHISKKLLRQTLTLSTMGYFGFNDKDCFVRTSMDYALTDELHLLFGVDIFAGEDGLLGQYKDNDEVWIKAKYSF